MGMKNRLIEVGIASIVSILASAFVTSWTLSERLANFENGIKSNTEADLLLARSMDQNRASITAIEGVNSNQNSAIAVSDTRWLEVQRRLGTIEGQMTELLSRR